jgi:transposase
MKNYRPVSGDGLAPAVLNHDLRSGFTTPGKSPTTALQFSSHARSLYIHSCRRRGDERSGPAVPCPAGQKASSILIEPEALLASRRPYRDLQSHQRSDCAILTTQLELGLRQAVHRQSHWCICSPLTSVVLGCCVHAISEERALSNCFWSALPILLRSLPASITPRAASPMLLLIQTMKDKVTRKISKNKTRAKKRARSLKQTKSTKAHRRASRNASSQGRFFRPNAAGIDIGALEIFVAVPENRDCAPVRSFLTFTRDLRQMATWLKECRIDTIAMESTGVYCIPVFQILEEAGLEVCLVNARHVKNVPGRKSDVKDCQWLQYLHSVGLLEKSFRPPAEMCAIRSILRHRQNLMQAVNTHVLHIHKCLTQMNLQIQNVLSDITGESGLRMLDAILAGQRDPEVLAEFRHKNVKAKREDIIKSLEGDYRAEHLFVLGQALAAYRFTMAQVQQCDEQVLLLLSQEQKQAPQIALENPEKFESAHDRSLAAQTARLVGVDLTAIEGLSAWAASNLISEIGCDISAWPTVKHFASWLGLCPDNRISGGKVLSSSTRHVPSRANYIIRMCAYGVGRSKGPLGEYHRKMRARLGPAQATIATAHKIARLIYHSLKTRQPYSREHLKKDMQRAELAQFKRLRYRAEKMGYMLVPDLTKMRAKARTSSKNENENTSRPKA